jgi:hypothetical protein
VLWQSFGQQLHVIGVQVMSYLKIGDDHLNVFGVKMKLTGPATDPCGTPYFNGIG